MARLQGVYQPDGRRLCAPVLSACPLPGFGGYAGLAGRPTRSVRVRSLAASFTVRQVADSAAAHLAEPERPVENAVQQLAEAGFVDVAQTARVAAEGVPACVQIKDRNRGGWRRGVSRK